MEKVLDIANMNNIGDSRTKNNDLPNVQNTKLKMTGVRNVGNISHKIEVIVEKNSKNIVTAIPKDGYKGATVRNFYRDTPLSILKTLEGNIAP